MPHTALAGGKGHTLLAECPCALLQFFDTRQACALRLVCREFQAAVAAHPVFCILYSPLGGQGDGHPGQHWRLARVLSAGAVR